MAKRSISPRLKILKGRKFGSLIVLERCENSITSKTRWFCKCDCGNSKIILGASLISGATKSCGCLVKINNQKRKGKYPAKQIANCLVCGKSFSYYIGSSIGKYCNKKCYGKSISGKRNINWIGGKTQMVCANCGELLNRYQLRLKTYSLQFCNIKCHGEWQSKNNLLNNNPNWNGGKSFEPYPIFWNEKLREMIRERDDRKCKLCNIAENGEKLIVHHIDYDKKNCDPSNLISLCHDCHIKTNYNREYWNKYFSNFQSNILLAVNQ